MDDKITGTARFRRDRRHWQVLIEAPQWVIDEFVAEARERGIHILNHGGLIDGRAQHTMLLGTSAGGADPLKPSAPESDQESDRQNPA